MGEAIAKLHSLQILRSLRPILQSASIQNPHHQFQLFDAPNQWDRASVELLISQSTFQKWLHNLPSSGIQSIYFSFYKVGQILGGKLSNPPFEFLGDDNDAVYENGEAADKADGEFKKLIVFSGNDYLGLSSHPMVRDAAIKACLDAHLPFRHL